MDGIANKILDKAEGAITEAYKDLVHPIAEPLGIVAGFPFRALRIAMGPIEKWFLHQEYMIKSAAESLNNKVKDLPEEKVIPLEPYIAVPAIMQLSYCENSEELKKLYVNLLASSMNIDKKYCVHPAFVDIIKQMSPDEAKWFSSLVDSRPIPLIDVNYIMPDGSGRYHTFESNFTGYGLDLIEYPNNINSYIENLSRLGLVTIDNNASLKSQMYHDTLEAFDKFYPYLRPKTSDNWERKFIMKLAHKSNFGRAFFDACCK